MTTIRSTLLLLVAGVLTCSQTRSAQQLDAGAPSAERGKPIGWAVIVPQVAKLTRVCVYDRAGLGRSDPAPLPRTSVDVAKDLHALLERAHIAPPYVFAGQSFGVPARLA